MRPLPKWTPWHKRLVLKLGWCPACPRKWRKGHKLSCYLYKNGYVD